MTVTVEPTDCYVKARGDGPQRPNCFECDEGILVFEGELYPDQHDGNWIGASITCSVCKNSYYDSVLPKHIATSIRVTIRV